jgi:hypothetical protein
MYRSYGPKTQRPVLLARAAEERANRELDSAPGRDRRPLCYGGSATEAGRGSRGRIGETRGHVRVGRG